MLTGATVLVLHVPVLVAALLLLSHAASAQPSTCDKDSGEKWCESLQTCHYDWDIWCPTSASCQTDDDCRVWLGGCGPYGCQCTPLGIDEPNPTECDPGMLKPCACAGCIPGRCDDVAAACVEGTCGLAAAAVNIVEIAPPVPVLEEQVFCSTDVFECGDGVYVSRDPKNDCAFPSCPSKESAQPTPVCKTDQDCRSQVFSNYCGGCNCDALHVDEAIPTSCPKGTALVNCLADPCTTPSQRAASCGSDGKCQAVVETPNNGDATAAAATATAREIWNDTNGDSYPWRPSDPCIDHPTFFGGSVEAYTNAIVALTEALNNPKVTRDLARNILFNTKAVIPMEQCESLLAMAEERMPWANYFTSQIPESTRNALMVARDEFMARTEPEPTITMLPAKKIITGTKCGAFDMILDIRSKEEWDAGHIMGATHMDLFNNKDAEQTMKHLEGCKQCRVAVFDEEGPEIKNATRFLLGGGFERLYGGFNTSQMEYQMVNEESVEPKCVSEGADTCTSQISKLFCPVKLKQLSKPVEKMGIKQLTSLVPTEDDADLEYCTSLDRFRIEAAKVAVDGEFPDMTIKLARKFRKKAKKLMKQRDCSTIIEK